MNDAQLEVLRVEISKLELTPENVLLVRVPVNPSMAMVARLEEGIRGVVSKRQPFMIVTNEIEFTVLARSDAPGTDREDDTHA